MSWGSNIKMQDHGENSNNNRLTAHRMEELLKEDHEARRQQRRCHNVVRFIGYSFLMAGIAYCIYDINSIKSTCPTSRNNPPCQAKCVTPTCPTCPACTLAMSGTSPVSPTCPACPTPIPCPPVPRISQTCPSPSPCPSTILKTCPPCPSCRSPDRALQVMAGFKNSLYLLRKLPTNHAEARAFCQSKGLTLLTITSNEENQWVFDHFKTEHEWAWLDATRENLNPLWKTEFWRWHNQLGTMWRAKDPASDVFQNWHKTQPGNEAGNECCLAMSFLDGKWHDVPCNADYNAVCKYTF